ncbi:DISARM system SNF2-like helicase DrmD [Cellulomonas iranensis]|uniref:DISARM system SNF2-like helicase DrmD n=1 Tax=Cellulomonas iranensis TaxID=76862 RepID=UPI002277381B|nr:DISARM system SNF2-like helicase DrmD [Cellulomonas iranensis]
MQTHLPEVGQMVHVRGARWVVTDVATQALPRSSADDDVTEIQHAVTLQAMGEDATGDELRVVWEIEPGRATVTERGLPRQVDPEQFDDPGTLAAFVDALRWGAVTSADPGTYQAPFRSGAAVEPYQLEPLRRALSAPRTNLLLADDVGLGKTIEAGLVIQELLLRHRARSVVVVCPAGLVQKWHDEMLEKFGLSFEVISSQTMKDVRRRYGVHANPFVLFPRVIVSMSWLPGPRAQRMLQSAFDAARRTGRDGRVFDVLVVDEAHHVAPSAPHQASGRRGYAVDSQRTAAVRDLARRCEHRLFLSATPHNGYEESFTALLEMIDEHRFARGAQIDRTALAEVAVRRLKSDVPGDRFRERQIRPLPVEAADDEAEMYDRLTALLDRRRRAAAGRPARAADISALLLKKRFLSSPWAFARTAAAYLEARRDGREPDLPEFDDLWGDAAPDEEEGRAAQPELGALTDSRRVLEDLSPQDEKDLEDLVAWGRSYEARPDTRLTQLVRFLDGEIRSTGTWSNERVVVFTEYVDTLEWIERVLRTAGYDSDRLAVIHGQTPPDEREDIRLRFNADPSEHPVRVLLATDAAGEGIDLQRYCHRLVNFDVPFNPNRLEQRIGRIDRYGQTQTPVAWHFAPVSGRSALDRDVDLLRRLLDKMQRVRNDLGSANDVLAPDLEEELLGRRPRASRPARDDSTRAVTDMLAGDRRMSAELTRITEGLDDVRRRLHLHPANVHRVVDTALQLAGQPTLQPVGDVDTDAPVFAAPTAMARTWALAVQDLDDPLTSERRRLTFDEEAARGRTDLVHAHLGHPLVRLATRALRQELWSPHPSVQRVTAVVVPGLRDSFAAAVARLVLVGGSGVRLHEEVFLAGTRLRRRQDLGEELSEDLLATTLDGQDLRSPGPDVLRALAARWNEDGDEALRARVERAVQVRADRRLEELEESLRGRREADLARVDGTFSRFRQTLQRSVAAMEQAARQAEEALFELEGSARQRRRDIDEVRRRLDVLDDELDRERRAVEARYQESQHHALTGALVFALTPADAEGSLA